MSDLLRPQHIAVIGAGVAGRQFALRCVRSGFAVALEDVMPEKLRRAQDLYGETANRTAGLLRFATEVEDAVADADIAIDFVPDELESKLEIFSLLDRMAPPRTILLTPTDVLSISDLASCTYRAERCVGVRGGLSAEHATLVRGQATGDEPLAAVRQMCLDLGLGVSVTDDRVDTSLAGRVLRPTLVDKGAR